MQPADKVNNNLNTTLNVLDHLGDRVVYDKKNEQFIVVANKNEIKSRYNTKNFVSGPKVRVIYKNYLSEHMNDLSSENKDKLKGVLENRMSVIREHWKGIGGAVRAFVHSFFYDPELEELSYLVSLEALIPKRELPFRELQDQQLPVRELQDTQLPVRETEPIERIDRETPTSPISGSPPPPPPGKLLPRARFFDAEPLSVPNFLPRFDATKPVEEIRKELSLAQKYVEDLEAALAPIGTELGKMHRLDEEIGVTKGLLKDHRIGLEQHALALAFLQRAEASHQTASLEMLIGKDKSEVAATIPFYADAQAFDEANAAWRKAIGRPLINKFMVPEAIKDQQSLKSKELEEVVRLTKEISSMQDQLQRVQNQTNNGIPFKDWENLFGKKLEVLRKWKVAVKERQAFLDEGKTVQSLPSVARTDKDKLLEPHPELQSFYLLAKNQPRKVVGLLTDGEGNQLPLSVWMPKTDPEFNRIALRELQAEIDAKLRK